MRSLTTLDLGKGRCLSRMTRGEDFILTSFGPPLKEGNLMRRSDSVLVRISLCCFLEGLL